MRPATEFASSPPLGRKTRSIQPRARADYRVELLRTVELLILSVPRSRTSSYEVSSVTTRPSLKW